MDRPVSRAVAPRPRWKAAFAGFLAAVGRYLRSAPGTFIWLVILFATTIVLSRISPEFRDRFLARRSTNLHELARSPVRVLIVSALWLDGGGWWGYLVLYNIFHVPAERWLGTLRWLCVVAITHVGATYISEGVLYLAIRHGRAPKSAVFTLDVGVSYALVGVIAVLTYLIASPWRYPYCTALLTYLGIALIDGRTFTDVGHFTAALLGLACYPLVVGRSGSWNPATSVRALSSWLGARFGRRSDAL
jgi:hypothetical protein